MIEQISALFTALAVLALAAVQTLYFTHMWQLNSYRYERFARWLFEHPAWVWKWSRWLCIVALFTLLLPPSVGGFVSAGWLCVCAWCNRLKKAKKPLVYTARIKRLLTTTAVLWIAIVSTLWWLPRGWALWLCVVCLVAPWVILLLASVCNQPLESAIARGFTEDAKRRLREMPQLTVIGITGSFGKTSTKQYLHALLSVRYNVLMTPENFNTPLGLVRTIREHLKPMHQIFLAEMGAKNVGDIRELCELVHPTYGIITSVGEQHLETFGSVDNILRTKFELADALPTNGHLFLNMDNTRIRDRADDVTVPFTGYGLTAGDYRADSIKQDAGGMHFTVTAPDGSTASFTTRLLGEHTVQNLVGCIAVAHHLGIPLDELVYPVRMLKAVEHRLQLLPGGIIDDAYNSNPAGFRSALNVLRAFEGQRVLVTPGMVELGERQDPLNRELGAFAADCCDYAVLVGVRQALPLKEGLLSAGFDPSRIFVAETLQEGMSFVRALPAEGPRTILLENDLPDNF